MISTWINTSTLKLLGVGIAIVTILYVINHSIFIYNEYKRVQLLEQHIALLDEANNNYVKKINICEKNNSGLKDELKIQNEKIDKLKIDYINIKEKLNIRTKSSERELASIKSELERAKNDSTKSIEDFILEQVQIFQDYTEGRK